MSSMHLSRVLSPVQLALTPSPLAVLVSIFGVVGEETDCGAELILDTVAVEITGFFGVGLEVEGEWCSAVPLVPRTHVYPHAIAIFQRRDQLCFP